ncbi:hypothetical protein CBR_g21259 [Chara braunii]|uniref:Uncharacterized protein n=1 Tax=Chara braunii TaxID=69332 RepID=A0A388L146_CHABU|nr:hypothetical protein CBR_g21259 [Chara braunii]|eukprot:GBG76019.1 hypothetical protein CBR_g21259 [Chara braunii]
MDAAYCKQYGHFIARCPLLGRVDGWISGTSIGQPPVLNPQYAPSAPPLAALAQQVVNTTPSAGASSSNSRSPSPAPTVSNAIMPYQPRTTNGQFGGGGGWNNQFRGNQGEIASLHRELVNSDREKREKRREFEEKKLKEEQLAKFKEEEEKRRDDEAKKEAVKEVRSAKLFAEQFATMSKKKGEEVDPKRDPAKGKEKEDERSVDARPKVKDGGIRISNDDMKKRGQEVLQGGSPVQPDAGRQTTQPEPTISPLNVGLLVMSFNRLKRDQDSFQRNQKSMLHRMVSSFWGERFDRAKEASSVGRSSFRGRDFTSVHVIRLHGSTGLGFDRVREGKKAVVASTGVAAQKRYLEDMTKELIKEYKADLEILCQKDNIKYVNKKQAASELAELRTRDAYGEADSEEKDDEDLINAVTSEEQEENPS